MFAPLIDWSTWPPTKPATAAGAELVTPPAVNAPPAPRPMTGAMGKAPTAALARLLLFMGDSSVRTVRRRTVPSRSHRQFRDALLAPVACALVRQNVYNLLST